MKSLLEKFSSFFPENLLKKGRELLTLQKVMPQQTGESIFVCEVDADDYAEARFEVVGKSLVAECECSEFLKGGGCAHLAASLIAADKFGDLSKACKRSVRAEIVWRGVERVSEPDAESSEVSPEQETPVSNDDCIEYEAAYLKEKKVKDQTVKVEDAVVPDLQPLMKSKITEAGKEFRELKVKVDGILSGNLVFDYIWNLEESEKFDRVVVQIFWRQFHQDRGWSDPQALNFLAGDPVPSPEDARVLRYITPAKQRVKQYSVNKIETLSNVYRLKPEKASVILPELARRGRLFARHNCDAVALTQVEFSEDHNWQFLPGFSEFHGGVKISGMISGKGSNLELSTVDALVEGGLFLQKQRLCKVELYEAFSLLKRLRQEEEIFLTSFEASNFVKSLVSNTLLPVNLFPQKLVPKHSDAKVAGYLYVRTAKYKYRNQEQLHAEVSFAYNQQRIDEFSNERRVYDPTNDCWYERDQKMEEELTAFLYSLGFRFNTNPATEEYGWKLLPSKLDDTVKVLVRKGWLVTAEGKTYRRPQEKKAVVKSGVDWFELHGGVEYNGEEIPLPLLLEKLKKGADYVVLGDGSFGLLPVEWLQSYTALTEIGEETEDGAFKFKRHQALLLRSLLSQVEGGRADKQLQQVCNEISSAHKPQSASEPYGFTGKLRDYQAKGLGWMIYLQQLGLGGVLADDMGLGKTVQVLALIGHRLQAGVSKPTLIVVPRSLLFNWEAEAAKFMPSLKVKIHRGPGRDKAGAGFGQYNIILTTYGTLRQDITLWKSVSFDYCILDEAQAIKNADTDAARAVRLVDSDYRLSMTGTPVENHIGDLLSQFEFLNPGMMTGNGFVKKIARLRNLEPTQLESIKMALSPLIMRRTKGEVLKELPSKTEQVLWCEMEEWQQGHYEELRTFYQQALQRNEIGAPQSKIEALSALLRLRQTACHPGLVSSDMSGRESGKTLLLLSMIDELREEGHKVLVFSQFTSFLGMISSRLRQRGIQYCYIDGQTADRGAEVERFQNNDEFGVFLISLKAGGTGLNLTAASYVFLADPWWNPAIEAQAVDRAYRMGQKNKVVAYRMIAKGSVEEKVLQLQNKKRLLSDNLIQETQGEMQSLSMDDLQFFFSS